jgi:hypothetical protein
MAGVVSFVPRYNARATPARGRSFTLMAACCRWPVDAGAIADAAAAEIDWRIFASTVRRHRVAGLVQNAVERAGLSLPSDIADEIADEARVIARQSFAHALESVPLQRLFDSAGISAVFLKGVALAQAAYGKLTLKQARDIDVLLPAAAVEAAIKLLDTNGYLLAAPMRELSPAQIKSLVAHGHEVELERQDSGLRVVGSYLAAGAGQPKRGSGYAVINKFYKSAPRDLN